METQTIAPRVDNSLTSLQTAVSKKGNPDERNENSGDVITPIENTDQHLDISENALKLSESFQSSEAQENAPARAIPDSNQAREIAESITRLIKQFPTNGLAAQSNLTSSVVKELLG